MNRPVLSCIFVGGGGLLSEAVRLTMARGHRVLGIVGAVPGADGIAAFASVPAARAALGQRPDVLFSIVNPVVLAERDLAWPLRLAVNFHDAPLPRYAGVNATSWAIFNGETTHGISWHRMAGAVDAGEILIQREFELSADDTALALNLKCYEYGLATFPALLDLIERGEIHGAPQNLKQRTIFRLGERLPRNGVLSFDQPTATICRQVRSGLMGPYENSFGLAKVLLPGGRLAAVGRVRPRLGATAAEPGAVLEVGPAAICVAATDGSVLLSGLRSLDGLPLDDPPCLEGIVLPALSEDDIAAIQQAEYAAAQAETKWIARLGDIAPPLTLPECRPQSRIPAGQPEALFRIELPADCSPPEAAARAVLVLARRMGRSLFSVGAVRSAPVGFAQLRPVNLQISGREVRSDTDSIRRALAAAADEPAFPLDVPLRFPKLRGRSDRLRQITIVVDCDAPSDEPATIRNPGIRIAADSRSLTLRFAADSIAPDAAAAIAGAVAAGMPDPFFANPPSPPRNDLPLAHEQVADAAARFGRKTAVEMNGVSLTYSELAERSCRLARMMRARGAGPEIRIGVLIPRSVDFIVSLLAIMQSGAAFIPLEPDMPLALLAEIVGDANPLFLVCNDVSRDLAARLGVPAIDLDASYDTADAPPFIAPTQNNLAYVLYTSGSTGSPKGSMIEHAAFARFLQANNALHGLSPDDRVLQMCATAFDAALEEIFGALSAGATLVLRPDDLFLSSKRFLDFCDQQRLTVIGVFAAMLDDVISEMERRSAFPETVRLVTTGGEAVAARDVQRWRRFFASRAGRAPRLVNVYGLTETTIANVTCNLSEAGLDLDHAPIGAPLAGNRLRVVDDAMAVVPGSGIGELLIGGPQLARAYLNRPNLTAAKFMTDPADGGRWFRTGDLVRRSEDGRLVFLGRMDQQLKVRGNRVEPLEIEKALADHPAVAQCCVLSCGDVASHAQLTAFWVAQDHGDAHPPAGEFRAFLAERLPRFMAPSVYRRLDAFPLTHNGKIDRAALRAEHWLGDRARPGGSAPRSFIEGALVNLFRQTLERSDLGVHDSFFDMGGDSLSAMRLVSGIAGLIGRDMSIGELFAAPTVAELAKLLADDEAQRDEAGQCVVPLQPRGGATPVFMVHGISGDVFSYLSLAAALAPDRPVFGVQAAGSRPESVEEMAVRYAAQIRLSWPHGPYHLIGFSAGGWFAYAVAVELRRQGAQLGMVCMFDTAPVARAHFRFRLSRLLGRAQEEARRGDFRAFLRPLRRIADRLYRQLRLSPAHGAPTGAAVPAWSEAEYMSHLLRFRPARVPLHVDVISPPATVAAIAKFIRFYAKGGVTEHLLFVDHMDFVEADCAPELAARLRDILRRTEDGRN